MHRHCIQNIDQPLGVGETQPRQSLLRKYVPRWLKSRSLIEGTDMEMCFQRRPLTLAGQRRSASGTEAAQTAGGRIELRYLALRNDIRFALECHEDTDRCSAVPPTTLAMAPRDRFRLTARHETHRAAETASLELIGHGTTLLFTGSDRKDERAPYILNRDQG
jgi:hypothetical protein